MNNKKILILRLSAIGDTVHTLPVASALKARYSGVFIGWVVEKKASAFLENNPCIDKLYVLEDKTFNSYLHLIKQVRADGYDVVVDAQGLFKSSIIMPFSGAKRRIGFNKTREFSYLLANEKIEAGDEFDLSTHIIDRNLKIAKYLGSDVSNPEFILPSLGDEVFDKYLSSFDKGKPIITLSPATTWGTKHWSEKSWSEVLDGLSGEQVVFTGTKNDLPLIERIISGSQNKNALILAGKTNLLELASVFKYSDVVVSPDSGSAHIAVAVNGPKVVCILGPTSEIRNGAYGKMGDMHINLIKNVTCGPCYKKKCPKSGNNNKECILGIKSKDVLKKINNILIKI